MTGAARPVAALSLRRALVVRLAGVGAVAAVGLVLLLTIGISRPAAEDSGPASVLAAAARPQPGAAVPARAEPAPVDRPHASDAAELRAWSQRVAGPTGIPPRALQGYALAEMWMRSESPECGLSWSTLAGIGEVASGHGTDGGGRIGADGATTRAIVGKDKRLGPLHVPQSTWKAQRFRASRDGERPDAQNVDDAAVTVARQLCEQRDLATPKDWWSAVRAHGGTTRFAQDVFTAAGRYAANSRASNG